MRVINVISNGGKESVGSDMPRIKTAQVTLLIDYDPKVESHPSQWNFQELFDLSGGCSVRVESYRDPKFDWDAATTKQYFENHGT